MEEAARQREEVERQRAHEQEMARLRDEGNARREGNQERYLNGKAHKLLSFIDRTGEIDCYLQRFEKFARANQWEENTWAVALSALLAERAFNVNSCLSDEAVQDYATPF